MTAAQARQRMDAFDSVGPKEPGTDSPNDASPAATEKSKLDSAVHQWCGYVGGDSDEVYKAKLAAAIRETSDALMMPAIDPVDRAQVLEDQAQLVGEWLRLEDGGVQ